MIEPRLWNSLPNGEEGRCRGREVGGGGSDGRQGGREIGREERDGGREEGRGGKRSIQTYIDKERERERERRGGGVEEIKLIILFASWWCRLSPELASHTNAAQERSMCKKKRPPKNTKH